MKKRVCKYFDAYETLGGSVEKVIARLQAIVKEFPDAEITVYDSDYPEIEGWRDETDYEYAARLKRERATEEYEKAQRRLQYEQLKKEFENAWN